MSTTHPTLDDIWQLFRESERLFREMSAETDRKLREMSQETTLKFQMLVVSPGG